MTQSGDVVTGAFSYTGKYITERLLQGGRMVRTLTNHPNRTNPFGDRVKAFSYDFDHPQRLIETLRGTNTLYSTYWVRYPFAGLTFEKAVENSKILFQAAKQAGVRRIVHVSIANPSKSSALAYYSGKAFVEEALIGTGISHAIMRPTVIFGKEDILINNIAWMVRHSPVFAVPGDGNYKIQPIYVEDFADALVSASTRNENEIRDAVGPEAYSFNELIRLIAKELKKNIHLIHLPSKPTYWLTSIMGKFLGDVILTEEEIQGLMDNLLVSKEIPLGKTCLSQWIHENKQTLGASYANEVKRHF